MPHHPDCPARLQPATQWTCPSCGHRLRGRFTTANAAADTRPLAARLDGANRLASDASHHADKAAKRNRLMKRRLRRAGKRGFRIRPLMAAGFLLTLFPLLLMLAPLGDKPTLMEVRAVSRFIGFSMVGMIIMVSDMVGLFDYKF